MMIKETNGSPKNIEHGDKNNTKKLYGEIKRESCLIIVKERKGGNKH